MRFEDQCRAERYFAPDQLVNENPRAVKVTHSRTGLSACSEHARTAVQNIAHAMRELRETVIVEDEVAAINRTDELWPR